MTGRRAVTAISLGMVWGALAAAPAGAAQPSDPHWVAAWATALQPIPDLAAPPPLYRTPAVAGRTVRQVVYPTLSGPQVRVRISNIYSSVPLSLGALQIARSAGGAAVQEGSSVPITFGGRRGLELAPGQEALSDPIPYAVHAGEPYAVSAYMGSNQTMKVWHRVSNQLNYVSEPGDHVAEPSASAYRQRFTQFAWLTELAVEAPQPGALAIAAIGDSITDGLRSSLDANRRWPDALARRLAARNETGVGVVNLGISGNRLLSDSACYGTALDRRFAHDALARAGVKAAIVLIGINDINFAAMPAHAGLDCDAPHTQVDARMLIDAYRRLIEAAHRSGVLLYGATLTPADLPPAREAVRQSVNAWIRSSGAFDGVVDFDAALRDPAQPTRLLPRYNSGDGIHPSDAGYTAMAEAVPVQRIVEAARKQ